MQILFLVLGILTTILFAHQIVYLFVGLFGKPKVFTEAKENRYAVLISARNEECVIGHLLNSINRQTYPIELVDIYVVADNCTDKTAEISRKYGAMVYERFDTEKVGKGYALDFLLDHIKESKGEEYYDGFFVFDADNILEPDFIEQMNLTFSAGYKIITSYRNSKNYDANWISSGYALWFLREARYVNNSRMILNTSCAISGTGFLFHRDMLKKRDGWKCYLLTEDIEFTTVNVTDGEKVGYCHKAMLYDEQPETFSQSWTQRLRWARGFLQVFFHHGFKLFKGIFKNKNKFSCFDIFATIAPMIFLTIISIGAFIVTTTIHIINGDPKIWSDIILGASSILGGYLSLFMMGLFTVATEWRTINATAPRKVLFLFTFPLYMATWIPIGIVALFKKVEWKPITHNVCKGIDEMKAQSNKTK